MAEDAMLSATAEPIAARRVNLNIFFSLRY